IEASATSTFPPISTTKPTSSSTNQALLHQIAKWFFELKLEEIMEDEMISNEVVKHSSIVAQNWVDWKEIKICKEKQNFAPIGTLIFN
ncbi:hypothetical protein Leryth_022667, partial [Lithospermum erythrorhizon]